ncbi:MAG: protein of unknown function DUF814 [Barrevirus sp.]|uniref:NFACT RNA-binding domain-containing protein n=1 Tax=Barrevirus sp. TaxID=2487763 RepID=A0A3G4ZQ83_9VIRU|nr:MAG: protein of unknown function DUF814 [Barrevirus sp.]
MVKEDLIYPNNRIRIGQNAIENDNLIKESKETDIWFHISGLPSCHLIIDVSTEYPLTKQMIYYCANLVKENTKYKNLPKIKVNYCPIKNVSRTKVPGKVVLKGKVNSIII